MNSTISLAISVSLILDSAACRFSAALSKFLIVYSSLFWFAPSFERIDETVLIAASTIPKALSVVVGVPLVKLIVPNVSAPLPKAVELTPVPEAIDNDNVCVSLAPIWNVPLNPPLSSFLPLNSVRRAIPSNSVFNSLISS